eukprot:TRINITY_DN7391_c0_g5_i1.p2 TRINITY_DN7391_c0_g5~~TRINITY_DN7391_c0_g5_i1.p2  ORF type:complete len:164 (+),score=2.30 TRINITY_DN7391_c0_g5_i1:227-718(+)
MLTFWFGLDPCACDQIQTCLRFAAKRVSYITLPSSFFPLPSSLFPLPSSLFHSHAHISQGPTYNVQIAPCFQELVIFGSAYVFLLAFGIWRLKDLRRNYQSIENVSPTFLFISEMCLCSAIAFTSLGVVIHALKTHFEALDGSHPLWSIEFAAALISLVMWVS